MTLGKQVSIQLGQVHASREPAIIRTVLGSCIAACLRDPVVRVGGMNHFMLPAPLNGDAEDPARFGVHAMELLIGGIQKLGGERRRLEAKVFGGGHVLDVRVSAISVPQQNIEFITEFLAAEGITLVARDVGGCTARQVMFYTDTGKVLIKRLGRQGLPPAMVERQHQVRAQQQVAAKYGEITLFDD